MGCVQAKPSKNSPPPGLDKLKVDNGYIPNGATRSNPAAAAGGSDGGGEGKGSEEDGGGRRRRGGDKRAVQKVRPKAGAAAKGGDADELVNGWPRWLTDNIPKEVLAGLVPKSADSYDKLDKVGQGTYSNVYKARDRDTGKIVALKKVRFDTSESESVKFMAREIMILQKLDHPNVIKLEGIATSRMQYSLYLVFDFMQTDLARVISRSENRLTEPQVKCYMQQLLSGLQHCHERGILHRDIKGSNLLIDKSGMLKIADFGLANYFNPNQKRPLTSRVVTLWYRAPELLLGTTDYGVGIDLWSAGCLLAEMFAGRPVMPGRTEVEQLHRIFKLCGSPSEEYWRRLKLSTSFRPPQPYKSSISEAFRDFPSSSLRLLMILLALDPSHRGSASSGLQHEFFSTSPLACDLSGLPVVYKEEDDELNQPRDRRKRKKLKQKSRTQREGPKKSGQAMVQEKDDSGSKEERAVEPATRSPEAAGSSTGSTSSSVKPMRYSTSPTLSISPTLSPLREPARRSDVHRSASRNVKNLPPLPSTSRNGRAGKEGGTENKHRLEKRSASASVFRRFEGEQIPKRYIVE